MSPSARAELRRLRKPGLNVTHGKQRERVAFEPRADNGCDRHQDEQRIKSPLPELDADLHPGWHFRLLGEGKIVRQHRRTSVSVNTLMPSNSCDPRLKSLTAE